MRLSDWERSEIPVMIRLAMTSNLPDEKRSQGVLSKAEAQAFAEGLSRDLGIDVNVLANGDIYIDRRENQEAARAYWLGWMARARTH